MLIKADLLTHMAGEFPELQGTMGRIYAGYQGEDADVSRSIEEHYYPSGTDGKAARDAPSAPSWPSATRWIRSSRSFPSASPPRGTSTPSP